MNAPPPQPERPVRSRGRDRASLLKPRSETLIVFSNVFYVSRTSDGAVVLFYVSRTSDGAEVLFYVSRTSDGAEVLIV